MTEQSQKLKSKIARHAMTVHFSADEMKKLKSLADSERRTPKNWVESIVASVLASPPIKPAS